VIACLFLDGAQTPPLHAFPFAFAATALLLLAGFRLSLAVLVGRWTEAGRFRRRIAVVAVSDFSREFIERLRAEPDVFEIAGVYDDRLGSGRVPSLHANVPVRGSVADLVRDSREEKFDVIAVALPLSATQRIADVLEKLSSTVADLCLTTDLAGLAYRNQQFGSVGSNPVISIGEEPLKDWRAAKKACFDYVVGAAALIILSPLLALLALAVRLDSKGPILFRQPRLGFNNFNASIPVGSISRPSGALAAFAAASARRISASVKDGGLVRGAIAGSSRRVDNGRHLYASGGSKTNPPE
jgi:hypothetical protein